MNDLLKDIYLEEHPKFRLANDYELYLGKAKAKDFYWILNEQSHQTLPTGPQKWNREFDVETNEWRTIFKSVKSICRENKLKEFQFKFLHRIVITEKELCRLGIKQDNDCQNCGEEDSINHTFIHCRFTQSFQENVFN